MPNWAIIANNFDSKISFEQYIESIQFVSKYISSECNSTFSKFHIMQETLGISGFFEVSADCDERFKMAK